MTYTIYRTAPFSMTLNDPLSPISRSRHYLMLNISETARDRHSFNGILIGIYTLYTEECHFEWVWVILSDLAKYSMTRNVVRSFCDSSASCSLRYGDITIFNMADAKFGICGHVKGWQRLGNFGRDRPILGKMGAKTSPAEREFFCVVIHATFWQLRNGRFSPNLVMKRISMSRRGIRKDIFQKFYFRGHLPQNLKSKVGQTGAFLRAGYRSRDALQRDIVYSAL